VAAVLQQFPDAEITSVRPLPGTRRMIPELGEW
jgi:hypothetical protein